MVTHYLKRWFCNEKCRQIFHTNTSRLAVTEEEVEGAIFITPILSSLNCIFLLHCHSKQAVLSNLICSIKQSIEISSS